MIIRCKKCKIQLTEDLKLLEKASQLRDEDGVDFISKGFFFLLNDEDYFTNHAGDWVINNKSCLNLKNHTDRSRLNGCCGLDGTDGPNKLCINDHEVATEKSDCWMPHCVIFNKNDVIYD